MCNNIRRPRSITFCTRFAQIMAFLILITAIYILKPLIYMEQVKTSDPMEEIDEPLRRNILECMKQTRASSAEAHKFINGIPQRTTHGKCLIACVLRRNKIITRDKINKHNLLKTNRRMYDADSEVWTRFQNAVDECIEIVDSIFDPCEYASVFHECLNSKVEQILGKPNDYDADERWSDDYDVFDEF